MKVNSGPRPRPLSNTFIHDASARWAGEQDCHKPALAVSTPDSPKTSRFDTTTFMNAPAATNTEKLSIFQLVILILSIVILVVLIMDTLTTFPKEVSRLFQGLDLVICIIFLVDFCVRFRRAESKLAFMKWGWIDLLSSIPFVDVARFGRIARILRII